MGVRNSQTANTQERHAPWWRGRLLGAVIATMVLLSAAPANAGEQTTDGSEEPVAKAADSSFEIHKSADPPAETEVNSSEAVEYTITGQNTGDTELDDVTIIDDATDVTDDADYNEDARASSGRVVAFGYTKIKWTGSLDAGGKSHHQVLGDGRQ